MRSHETLEINYNFPSKVYEKSKVRSIDLNADKFCSYYHITNLSNYRPASECYSARALELWVPVVSLWSRFRRADIVDRSMGRDASQPPDSLCYGRTPPYKLLPLKRRHRRRPVHDRLSLHATPPRIDLQRTYDAIYFAFVHSHFSSVQFDPIQTVAW